MLVSLRDFQDEKADIIHKYYEEEAKALKAYGELPESAKINEAGDIFDEEDAANEDAPVTFTIGQGGDEDDSSDEEEESEKKQELDIDAVRQEVIVDMMKQWYFLIMLFNKVD